MRPRRLCLIAVTLCPASDMKTVCEMDEKDGSARADKERLEKLSAEKQEKMKEEMLGARIVGVALCCAWRARMRLLA